MKRFQGEPAIVTFEVPLSGKNLIKGVNLKAGFSSLIIGLLIIGTDAVADSASDHLASLANEIKVLNKVLSCDRAADCDALEYGHRICGGPDMFLIVSKKNSKLGALKDKVDQYNSVAKSLNEVSNLGSICSIEERPVIVCSRSKCHELKVDSQVCSKLKFDTVELQDACATYLPFVALIEGKPEPCFKIRANEERDDCLLALAENKLNPSICRQMRVESKEDQCLFSIAMKKQDPTICNQLKIDSPTRDACYSELAQVLRNPLLCLKVSEKSAVRNRNECKSNFK